jgi:ribulose bisphosphate carboxylase small subunit
MKDCKDQIKVITEFNNELNDLKNSGCTDSTIKQLESLVQRTYNYSKSVTNVPDFENNIRQTLSKQLKPLSEYRTMRRKRESYWFYAIDNFTTDLSMTITELESFIHIEDRQNSISQD